MSIIVTGATGQLGGLVVAGLLRGGAEPEGIVALGRDVGRLAALAESGVITRVADNDDPAALRAAFDGAERVLLVSGAVPGARVQQHRNVVAAAVAAGAERLVYTSALHADTSALVVAPDHKVTEQAIAESGIPAVVLRNGWYHENFVPEAQLAARTGVLLSATGAGRVASAARSDFAEAIVAALLGEVEPGAYELSGDRAWGYTELAAVVAGVTGREVVTQEVDGEALRRGLLDGGLPEGFADFTVAVHHDIAAGYLADAPGTLARLIGHPTTPLGDTLGAVLAGV